MASYTALMNIQVDSQQAQLGINNLNKNLTYLSRSSRLTNKSLLQMQQTFLRIENTINQATGNTASFNAKMQQAMNIIKKLRGEVSSLRSQINSLNNATGSAGTSATKATTAFQRFTKTLQQNQYFASLAVSALVGFVNQRLIGGIIRITDEYTLMENKIKTAIPSIDRLSGAMDSVYRIAQETRQPLEIVGNLYSRIGRNSEELRKDLTALNDVVSTVSKAFQIGGATIEESRNAMVQFSQALASGRLQGDELRSILELAPVLATSISKSIGITTGSLRRLASEGLITTEVLIKALLEAGKDIRTEFAKFTPTVDQSAESVINAFKNMIGSNERFKMANKALGNQLRQFSLALEKQGDIANALGDLYLTLAENVDKLAAAFVALGAVLAGAGILALLTFLTTPIGAISGVVAAVISLATYFGMAEMSAEKTAQQMKKIKEMAGKDYDFSSMSDKDREKVQQDLMKNQAVLQTLISEQENEVSKLNLEIEDYYKKLEEIYASGKGVNALELAQNEVSIALAKKNLDVKTKELEKYRDRFQEIQNELVKIEENAAMQAMLARSRAVERQKRSLKDQATAEQMSYLSAYGSGMSDKGLSNIKFANQAAQDLRKTISDITMKLTDRAFMGSLSVEKLFGGTDPNAAVGKLDGLIQQLESIDGKDSKGVVGFFRNLMEGGGPEAEKAFSEIEAKLAKEPFLGEQLKDNMVTVWKEALANYRIYAAERKAEEDRFVNTELRNMRNELQIMDWEYATGYNLILYALNEGVDAYEYQIQKADNLFQIERARYIQELDIKDITEENKRILLEQFDAKREYIAATVQQQRLEEGINQVLSNREKLREGEQEPGIRSRVGGVSDFGGASLYNEIGSTLRDINIEYEKAVEKNKSLYHMNTQLLINLNGQEKLLRDQNIQREIALKLENLKLEAARQAQSNTLLAEQIKLEEQGLNSSEVKIKLLLKETELQFDALDAMAQAGILEKEQANALQKSLGQLTLKRIEAEKLAKVQADLEATRPERGVGQAVIDGAQALFSGEFYSKIYDSLVSGSNYLLEGINKIEWSNLGTQIGDGLKNIDWNNLSASFKGGMGNLAGSGLFQGLASAGGASGQRALGIAQAGAAGGPVAALGAAILSNEKVQQALSKLFDAVFEFIDPFLDLLGPVVDIFTAMLKNNPIMTAVNALKPLLTNLGNMLSALASAIETLDLSQQGGTLGYIFGGGLASDLEENIGGTIEGFGQGISGFGGIASGIVEEFSRSIEEIMGSRYFKTSAERIKAGAKDFMDVYSEAYDEAANEMIYFTERVGKDIYTWVLGKKVVWYTEYTDYVRQRALTEQEKIDKAKAAVLVVLNNVLDGIEDETEALLDEADKLSNISMKTELEQATENVIGFRGLLKSLEEAKPSMTSKDYEDAKSKISAFVEAQETYFAAFTKNEILQATKDLEESVLSFQRMATGPMDQITRGLDSFTNQVTEFQNAIDAVSDPAKKAALQSNLREFKAAFEAVSGATASQMAQDIDIRGYDLTKEQELAIKYEKEIMDVRAREDLTAQHKVMIINRLIAAREREITAMEREQELLNLQGAQNALKEILNTFDKTIEGINDLIQSLYDQVQDLLFGEFNLDPYLQKFELASDTYGTLLEAAFDPDATEDDIKQLQDFVNTYLGTARDLYKSSSTFQQIFSNVLSDLSVLGVQAGFNMPQTAVSGATSEIQEFIDATENLSEDLSASLNKLIYDLNTLGMTFAQQKIDLIQEGLSIPLKITNNMIVVDLGSVNQKLTLTNENFSLDLTKLDLVASFEAITFTPDFGEVTDESGWQNYHKTATFTASIVGWDPFAGRAAYSATATFSSETDTDPVKYGWTDYAQTASFSAILLNWGEYNAEATLVPTITLGDYTSEVIVYATLKKSFTKLGETAQDLEGVHTGYARLDLNLQGTMTTSSGSPKQYYGYASLNPQLSGMYTNSWYPHTGYASFTPSVNFDYSSVYTAFNTLSSAINSSIQSFSQAIAESYNYIRLGFDYESGPYTFGSGSGYAIQAAYGSNTDTTEMARFGMASIGDQVAEFKRVFGNPISNYAVSYNHDGGMGVIQFYQNLSHAQSAYDSKKSPYLSHTNVKKYGFQQGGLVPGPMDTIPAMLAPGEYIMSKGAVETLGVSTLNSLNAGDLSALRQTGDPEVRRLLRELIVAVQTSDTEVNVYTDTKGETKAAINEFRTELRERSRRQGEKYVNVRYV